MLSPSPVEAAQKRLEIHKTASETRIKAARSSPARELPFCLCRDLSWGGSGLRAPHAAADKTLPRQKTYQNNKEGGGSGERAVQSKSQEVCGPAALGGPGGDSRTGQRSPGLSPSAAASCGAEALAGGTPAPINLPAAAPAGVGDNGLPWGRRAGQCCRPARGPVTNPPWHRRALICETNWPPLERRTFQLRQARRWGRAASCTHGRCTHRSMGTVLVSPGLGVPQWCCLPQPAKGISELYVFGFWVMH